MKIHLYATRKRSEININIAVLLAKYISKVKPYLPHSKYSLVSLFFTCDAVNGFTLFGKTAIGLPLVLQKSKIVPFHEKKVKKKK